jgi:hypothetical protein
MMTGIAMRSERIKITKRVVRQRIMDTDLILSEKDILDWLKFAQSETDGIKLDLAALLDAASDPLATKRPGGSGSQAGNGEDA